MKLYIEYKPLWKHLLNLKLDSDAVVKAEEKSYAISTVVYDELIQVKKHIYIH